MWRRERLCLCTVFPPLPDRAGEGSNNSHHIIFSHPSPGPLFFRLVSTSAIAGLAAFVSPKHRLGLLKPHSSYNRSLGERIRSSCGLTVRSFRTKSNVASQNIFEIIYA